MKIFILLTIFFSTLIASAQDVPPQPINTVHYRVKINEKGTYFPLKEKGLDPKALPATRVNLNDIKPEVREGTILGIRRAGGFSDGAVIDDTARMVGAVFVDDIGNTIAPGPASKVYEAQAYPFCGGPPLDVLNDFVLYDDNATDAPGRENLVQVPKGAVAILFGPADCWVHDNFDQNNDYEALIEVKGCKVSEIAKRNVEFFPQGGERIWAEHPYAFGPRQSNPTQKEKDDNKMRMVGCVTSSIAMVFDFYGIKTVTNQLSDERTPLSPLIVDPVPISSEINPGNLNKIFKGTADLNNDFVATYNIQNNVDYKNAAHAARASLQIECYRKAEKDLGPIDFLLKSPQIRQECYNQSLSKISYSGFNKTENNNMAQQRWVDDENGANYNWNDPMYLQKKKDGFKKIEELVCAGKPVLLRVARESDAAHIKGHTVVVTESFYDNKGTDESPDYQLSFKVHDPSRDLKDNKDVSLEEMANRTNSVLQGGIYKHVIGYDVFLDQADPAMMTVTSSDNVQFILTDYMGRKVGYDPISKTKYEEVPGAVYSYEGIAPNLDVGDIETEGNYPSSYQLFLSGDVQTGDYKLNVYGQGGGTAYITISKTDVNGSVSDTENHDFLVSIGSQKTINFKHNIQAITILNTDLKVNYSRFETNNTKIYGELKLPDHVKINCSDTLKINIGSQSDYSQVLSLSLFNKKPHQGTIFYEYETSDYKITISELGMYWVHIKNFDIKSINQANLGKFSIGVSDYLGRTTLKLNCNNNICNGE